MKVWDDMGRVRGLTASTGAQLLVGGAPAEDPDVQEATLACAWKATCGGGPRGCATRARTIAEFVLELSAEFDISFTDEEEVVANAVLDAINENANDVSATCLELRNASLLSIVGPSQCCK